MGLNYVGTQDSNANRVAVFRELGGVTASSISYNSCIISSDFVLPAGTCATQARSLEIAVTKTFEIGLASVFDIV